jgi:hypothetical protein
VTSTTLAAFETSHFGAGFFALTEKDVTTKNKQIIDFIY